jgi:hypothetical protein
MRHLSSSRFAMLALICVVTAASACGGSGGGGGITLGRRDGATTSGLAGNETIGLLTAAGQRTFCDWTASLYGGYGTAASCDRVSGSFEGITTPASQEACLGQFALMGTTCSATVAQTEACALAVAACDVSGDAWPNANCGALQVCFGAIP